jgi:phosphoglycerate dehydrogenase-like enzyme
VTEIDESTLPRVLFVKATDKATLDPWFGDFLAASAGICEVELFDPAKPIDQQFADVRAVVDLGGFGGHELIDAAQAAGVELWQVLGYGLDHIDVGYVLASGIPLAHTPGSCTAVPLAEHALHLMLTLEKRWRESQAVLASGRYGGPFGGELEGQTLGLVGFGASGRALGRRAAAFGMRVLAVDAMVPAPGDRDAAFCEWVGGLDRLDELRRTSDYVSLHLPLTEETEHLLDADAFGKMKQGVVIVNVARGRLIDQAALVDALRAGTVRGACLDVYEEEPLPLTSPLMEMENVVLTPHTAGLTLQTSRRRAEFAAGNIARLVGGGELEAVVS